MKGVFIDTGFVIALESVTDQNHEKASQLWNELLKNLPEMVCGRSGGCRGSDIIAQIPFLFKSSPETFLLINLASRI
jgi:hypothetical protein